MGDLSLFFNLFGLEIPVRRKIFKFEEMWLSDSRCGETVEVAWRHLAKAERIAMVSGDNFLVRKLKGEFYVLLDREARMWNQRSKVLWLNNGDNNTKYFRSKATKRFRRNSIMGIQVQDGSWVDQSGDIGQCFIWYYTELFTT